jgi:acetyl-CoA C-acetyltransferase
VTDDEQPRPETSEQQLAQLRPAFRPADGSVTAGNASSLNDGAAAVLLMSADKARSLGCRCWRALSAPRWRGSIRR